MFSWSVQHKEFPVEDVCTKIQDLQDKKFKNDGDEYYSTKVT